MAKLPAPSTRDDTHFLDNFNTPLTPEEENEFQFWLATESQRRGRNIAMDLYDYDVRGFWKAGETVGADGHGTDLYKKPSHPTFSNLSMYHGVDGHEGGTWDPDGAFHPGKSNMKYHGREGIQREFEREPGRPEHLAPEETEPVVDWKGFFSDRVTYELMQAAPDEFAREYQNLAALDPEMKDWAEEDHSEFISGMQQFNPTRLPLSEGNLSAAGDVTRAFAPLAEMGAQPILDQEAQREAAGLVTSAVTAFGGPVVQGALQGERALQQNVPGFRELRRGVYADELPQNVAGMVSGASEVITGLGQFIQQQMDTGTAATPRRVTDEIQDVVSEFGERDVPKFMHDAASAVGMTADMLVGPEKLKPGTKMWEAFKDPAELADWTGRALANVASSAGPTIAAQMVPVVGPAFSAGLSWSFVTDELMQAAQEQGTDMSAGEAALRQIPAAALDQLGAGTAAKGLRVGVQQAFGNWFANRLLAFGKTVGTEVATETSQQVLTMLNQRQAAGKPLNPSSWERSEWEELGETALQTLVGMVPFGAASATSRTRSETQAAVETRTKKMTEVIDRMMPEGAALQGRINLEPVPVPKEPEARNRMAPDYLTPEEATRFVNKDYQGLAEEVATRVGVDRTAEQITADLDVAEQRVADMLNPQHVPAQPSQEGGDVVTAIQDGIEQLAVQAEEEGLPELAAARRTRKGQVEVVEPRTLWERGLQGISQLGSKPRLVFYTQPKGGPNEPYHSGVFVRKGLIAVDVTDGNIAPKVILGTLLHEMTHNQEQMTPEAYQGAVDALRGTDLWKKSEADLRKDTRATVNDKEIMAHIMELEGVATDVMYAIANYTNVQDMAKAPSRVRALAEWMAKVFRTVVSKVGIGKSLEGQPLEVMQKIGALAADPEVKRNAAKAVLALHDMLTAPATAVAEPTAQEASQPQAPERLLAKDVTDVNLDTEPFTVPYGDGQKVVVWKEGKGYKVNTYSKSGRVTGIKRFPNIKAVRAYVNTVAGTKYSVSFQRLRELEGPESPRTASSVQIEQIRFREVRDAEYDLLLLTAQGASATGEVTPNRRAELMQKANEKADKWIRENMKVLERSEMSEAQLKFAEFAKALGIQITYYEGAEEDQGGFSTLRGQLWINANTPKSHQLSLPQVVAHEITHDLNQRHPVAWAALRDFMRAEMPREWSEAETIIRMTPAYRGIAGDVAEVENEIVSWIVHRKSNQFWNAVSALGAERKGPKAFKAFYSWLVDLMVRVNSVWNDVFRTDLYKILGIDMSAKNPTDVAAMMWAKALSQLTSEDGGAYSTLDPGGIIAVKHWAQDSSTKSPTEARLAQEVTAPRVESGEQFPLFSTKRTGYPPAAQSPQQFSAWRERLRKAIWRGEQGQMWYEDSAAAILAMTGGNLVEAHKFARVLAVYSPQQKVITNWHQAITAWERYKVGYTKEEFLRSNLGNRQRHEQAAGIIYDDQPWSGEKTNSFFNNLFSLLDPTLPKTVTIDMWMMRLFGFSGDAPTDAQYRAMSSEMKRLAAKMDVEPWQAQAMAWVYAKSVWEGMEGDVKAEAAKRGMTTHVPVTDKNGKVRLDDNGKAIMKQTPEYEALYRRMFQAEVQRDLRADTTKYPISAEAMTTFSTSLKRRVAVLSMEAVPGWGALGGLKTADLATKIEFHRRVEEALRDADGADIIAKILGYGPIGDLDTMFLGVSAYYDEGRIQINPARQMLLPTAAKKGAESSFQFDAASKEMFKRYAVIRGLLTHQNSVAGYRRFDTKGDEENRNMAEILPGRAFLEDEVRGFVDSIAAALKARNPKLEGWEIALYPNPGGNGMGFMNLKQSGLSHLEFHALLREVAKQHGFKKKYDVKTFQADTMYVSKEDYGGDTYADVLAGQGVEEQLREVESRVADKLAAIYVEFAGRGFGDAPAWATERVRKGAALEGAAREYPHFWHFSKEDVRETGIKREFAGTGAAGQERARFKYVDGKIDPESAVVHVYVNTGKAEYMVVTAANYLNKIIAKLKLVPIGTPVLKEILDEKKGDLMGMINALRSYGYDGIVDEERGMAQINRDIDVSEIAEGHELTPDERRAWKGALKLEDIDSEKRYDGLVVPKDAELTQAAVEHVASSLTKDGTAWFPRGTDEALVSQYFGEVRSTSVGLTATKPQVPSFSMRIGESETTPPFGKENVVDDAVAFGTQYSRRSGAGWSLPHMDAWTQFVKWFQDSFIQFKRLHEIIQAHGMLVTEGIDVRLAEERYHGMAQEQTRRIENRYIRPILVELRRLAKDMGVDYEKLLADFDDYLHAVHAPERNNYIQYVWVTKKLDDLGAKKKQLEDKIAIEQAALAAATSPTEQTRIKDGIRFYEMKLVKIEQDIDKVKNQPPLDSGMSDAKAAGILSALRQAGLTKPFGRLAATYVYRMLDERLNNLLKEGMITQQEYDAVNKYKHYVPLKGKAVEGDIDDLLNMYTGFTASSGFDVRGSELPFVVGRKADSKINPILAQAMTDVLMTADRIERNRVAVAMLDLAETYPNENLWEINKTVRKRIYDKNTGTVRDVEDWWARNQANVIAAKRGGETYYIYLKDRGLVEAMKGLGVENLWKWVHVLRSLMRMMAQLFTTFSPEFILTNFARDWQQAVVSSTTDMGKEAALEVANESRKAVRGILAANFPDALGLLKNDYTDAYHELKESGGSIGFFGMRGVEDMQKAILDEMKSGALVTTMRGGRRVGQWVASLNESTENGIRLATYVVAQKHGASKAKAASLAKNVTVNFNRRGDIGGAIGVGWLFFNASVQGIDRFWKSMQTPAGKKLAGFYIGMGFMTSMLARAAMGDDDDGKDRYDKISDFTKMRHWILPNLATTREDDYFTVPLPYGFGVWAQVGKELEHMLSSGQDRSEAASEAAVRMLSGFTTHFSPLGEASFNKGLYAMSRPIIPTLAEPFMDVLANETYWGGKIYPAKTSWDRRSRSARHYAPKTLTEKMFVGATDKLNHLTGGSEYRSGVLDINPNGLSYILDSYIGPTGQFMKRPFELAMKMKAGEDTLWNDWILLRRFVSETAPEYYVPGEYYDAVDDVAKASDEHDYLKKNGDEEDMKRFMDRHGWKLPLEKRARAATKTLKELRDRDDADSIEVRKRALEVQREFVKRYLQSERP